MIVEVGVGVVTFVITRFYYRAKIARLDRKIYNLNHSIAFGRWYKYPSGGVRYTESPVKEDLYDPGPHSTFHLNSASITDGLPTI